MPMQVIAEQLIKENAYLFAKPIKKVHLIK